MVAKAPTEAPTYRGNKALVAAERMMTEHQRSAGGVVADRDRLLLISTQNGRRWQLPKGHIEAGESAEDAAIREVREETGVTGRVVETLSRVEYWYVGKDRLRVHKQVDFFLLDYVEGDAANFDPAEVSGAEWFAWDEGLRKMSFPNERRVAEEARVATDGRPLPSPDPPGALGIRRT
jgi:8-oxo-dGTP pyrophosphatase MutT (NUDIX family)